MLQKLGREGNSIIAEEYKKESTIKLENYDDFQ